MKLKVITCNVWYARFYDELLTFIRSHDPDIVLLQEVTSGPELQIEHGISNAHQRLVADTSLYGHFAPMFKLVETGGFELGISILSKFPFKQTKSIYYYRELLKVEHRDFGVNFPGVYAAGEIELNNKPLWIISTHFLWSMYPEITNAQLEASTLFKQNLDKVDEFILAGDFNVTDESTVYATISSGLSDDRPENTKNSLHPQIHKIKGSKQLAVDYVFHRSNRLKKIYSEIPEVPVSDHLPVVVEYEVE